MVALIVAALACGIEAAFGYPRALMARIGHPVMWIGALIAALDKSLNRPAATPALRRAAGVVALLILLAVTASLSILIVWPLRLLGPAGWIIEAALASTLLAARSLHAHVRAVAVALETDGLAAARMTVAQIVGRDTASLDEDAVRRAAIETLAENLSDGVIAPLFWLALFGLPGAALYKAINTADSMIGHRTPRHEAFGWAAARLDDVVNLIPARLTALLIALAAPRRFTEAIRCAIRDARLHRSPNAGWPESAMARALNVRLSGPRLYQGQSSDEPWVNPDAPNPTTNDLHRALTLMVRACALAGLTTLALAISFSA